MLSEIWHATDEDLERYVMGLLDGPAIEEFEEHLLICADCQGALALTDAYLAGIRGAAKALRKPSRARQWFRNLLPAPGMARALGLTAVGVFILAGTYVPLVHRASAPPALVVLASTRGGETPLPSSAAAGKPLTLMLDTTGLQPLPRYKLEIVDAAGHPIFGSVAAPGKSALRAPVPQGLAAGIYYVRIYTPAQELLREYGLRVDE